MAATTYDLAIVGAGMVGVCLALDATGAGLRTLLIDRQPPGQGASAAAMGHLLILDSDADELALTRLGLRRWREYGELPAAQWNDAGTLWIAAAENEIGPLQARGEALAKQGIACQWLDGAALAEAEPGLRPGLCGALRVDGDALIYPPGALSDLLRRIPRDRLTLMNDRSVVQLEEQTLLLDDGSRIHAGQRVVCAGLHSAALLPGLPVLPRKGHLAITNRGQVQVRHALVEAGYVATTHSGSGVACNLQPRPGGQLLIGASRELGDSRQINQRLLGQMLARAIGFYPTLAQMPLIRCWTGIRPTSADGHPLIGRWPPLPNTWVAAGHEGLGITTAPATAQLLLAQLLGRPSGIDGARFDPSRALA